MSYRIEYFRMVLQHYKLLLGGGSALIVAGTVVAALGIWIQPMIWGGIMLACLLVALFEDGHRMYARLKARISIDDRVGEHSWPFYGKPAFGCYITVRNDSEDTVRDVVVQVVAVVGVDSPIALPAPLKIQHDMAVPPTTRFNLFPKASQNVELVAAIENAPNIQVRFAVPESHFIKGTACTLVIVASGNGVPSVKKTFRASFEGGCHLRCVVVPPDARHPRPLPIA